MQIYAYGNEEISRYRLITYLMYVYVSWRRIAFISTAAFTFVR